MDLVRTYKDFVPFDTCHIVEQCATKLAAIRSEEEANKVFSAKRHWTYFRIGSISSSRYDQRKLDAQVCRMRYLTLAQVLCSWCWLPGLRVDSGEWRLWFSFCFYTKSSTKSELFLPLALQVITYRFHCIGKSVPLFFASGSQFSRIYSALAFTRCIISEIWWNWTVCRRNRPC